MHHLNGTLGSNTSERERPVLSDSVNLSFCHGHIFCHQLFIFSGICSSSFSGLGPPQQLLDQKMISGMSRSRPRARPTMATRFWMLLGRFNKKRIFLTITCKEIFFETIKFLRPFLGNGYHKCYLIGL